MDRKVSGLRENPCLALRGMLCLALSSTFLPCVTFAQFTQSPPNGATPIARLQSGNFSNDDVESVARAGTANEVLPKLEKGFVDPTEVDQKEHIANALVRLGDKNNVYWDFLLQQATLAVDSDIPDPFRDSEGKLTNQDLSPDFKAWTQAHHVDVGSAFEQVTIYLPGKILLLGETGDPRGIPLLQRALQSHNYLIVAFAAKGLVKIQDRRSIPLIISATQQLPPEYRPVIAMSLVYFDDSQAQDAFDRYVPKEMATLLRESKAKGMGVFGW